MPYFVRTTSPPQVSGGYAALRPFVRDDFRRCCSYCLLHEFWAGGERNFELDHFRPVSLFPHLERDFYNLYYTCHVCNHLFPHLERDFYNLYYTCHVCNQLKHDHWPSPALEHRGQVFVDLCRDDFDLHYHLQQDGQLAPQTEAARYTLLLLRLNSQHLVRLRMFALQYGFRLDSPPD